MSVGKFALIGAAGYVAPRHLKAIKDIGGVLLAACDPADSVGILDSYFPDASFFIEFERFDRHIDALKRKGSKVDYVSICSPNFLHDSHVRFALRSDADAICEKPLVLNPWNVDALQEIELATKRKVNTILQLRLHPAIVALKKRILEEPRGKIHDVQLTYITSRGPWYHYSWKGDEKKSGGIVTNIGVHFFDMLGYLFGDVKTNIVNYRGDDAAAGYLEYSRARVRWCLSVSRSDLAGLVTPGASTYRSITIDGSEIEFSDGFSDLHTKSYSEIVAGRGFGLDIVRPSIEAVSHIRRAPLKQDGELHDIIKKRLQVPGRDHGE